jgi:alpha-D-xyloside xylohydrolase
MFGPAIMVNPVAEPGATKRGVYLPKTRWYDFWSGVAQDGGHKIDATAPLDRIPLYVRAGSIIPMGPDMQWSTEKPADPIELRVYPGADGDFVFYEDENDNYDYEKGVYATIPLHWDDGAKTLTIGTRKGTFPGMLQRRTFNVVFASDNHGAGVSLTTTPDKTVEYTGAEVRVAKP